jgi:hypothetical protein
MPATPRKLSRAEMSAQDLIRQAAPGASGSKIDSTLAALCSSVCSLILSLRL